MSEKLTLDEAISQARSENNQEVAEWLEELRQLHEEHECTPSALQRFWTWLKGFAGRWR